MWCQSVRRARPPPTTGTARPWTSPTASLRVEDSTGRWLCACWLPGLLFASPWSRESSLQGRQVSPFALFALLMFSAIHSQILTSLRGRVQTEARSKDTVEWLLWCDLTNSSNDSVSDLTLRDHGILSGISFWIILFYLRIAKLTVAWLASGRISPQARGWPLLANSPDASALLQ